MALSDVMLRRCVRERYPTVSEPTVHRSVAIARRRHVIAGIRERFDDRCSMLDPAHPLDLTSTTVDRCLIPSVGHRPSTEGS